MKPTPINLNNSYMLLLIKGEEGEEIEDILEVENSKLLLKGSQEWIGQL